MGENLNIGVKTDNFFWIFASRNFLEKKDVAENCPMTCWYAQVSFHVFFSAKPTLEVRQKKKVNLCNTMPWMEVDVIPGLPF
jgi:hypothetical protein